MNHDLETPAGVPGGAPATQPLPGDARSRAQVEVEAAVGALEAAREAPVAERLAAAEHAHEVLAAHLSGGRR